MYSILIFGMVLWYGRRNPEVSGIKVLRKTAPPRAHKAHKARRARRARRARSHWPLAPCNRWARWIRCLAFHRHGGFLDGKNGDFINLYQLHPQKWWKYPKMRKLHGDIFVPISSLWLQGVSMGQCWAISIRASSTHQESSCWFQMLLASTLNFISFVFPRFSSS